MTIRDEIYSTITALAYRDDAYFVFVYDGFLRYAMCEEIMRLLGEEALPYQPLEYPKQFNAGPDVPTLDAESKAKVQMEIMIGAVCDLYDKGLITGELRDSCIQSLLHRSSVSTVVSIRE